MDFGCFLHHLAPAVILLSRVFPVATGAGTTTPAEASPAPDAISALSGEPGHVPTPRALSR